MNENEARNLLSLIEVNWERGNDYQGLWLVVNPKGTQWGVVATGTGTATSTDLWFFSRREWEAEDDLRYPYPVLPRSQQGQDDPS